MITPATSPRCGVATAHLAEKVTQPLSLVELAAVAHRSPSALAKRFRQITGITPVQLHKQLKLQRARQLLATGTCTAAFTAAAVGYVSASHFSRDHRLATFQRCRPVIGT